MRHAPSRPHVTQVLRARIHPGATAAADGGGADAADGSAGGGGGKKGKKQKRLNPYASVAVVAPRDESLVAPAAAATAAREGVHTHT